MKKIKKFISGLSLYAKVLYAFILLSIFAHILFFSINVIIHNPVNSFYIPIVLIASIILHIVIFSPLIIICLFGDKLFTRITNVIRKNIIIVWCFLLSLSLSYSIIKGIEQFIVYGLENDVAPNLCLIIWNSIYYYTKLFPMGIYMTW